MPSPCPVPLPGSLVVKNGSQAREHLGRYVGACVADRDHHKALGGTTGPGGFQRTEADIRGLDGQPTASGHGIAGVDAQIQRRALELVRIGERRPRLAIADQLDRDPPAEGADQHGTHPREHGVDIGRLGGVGAREQLRIAEDDGGDGVEVVGDAGGQPSEHLPPLGEAEPLRAGAERGDILLEGDEVGGGPSGPAIGTMMWRARNRLPDLRRFITSAVQVRPARMVSLSEA